MKEAMKISIFSLLYAYTVQISKISCPLSIKFFFSLQISAMTHILNNTVSS